MITSPPVMIRSKRLRDPVGEVRQADQVVDDEGVGQRDGHPMHAHHLQTAFDGETPGREEHRRAVTEQRGQQQHLEAAGVEQRTGVEGDRLRGELPLHRLDRGDPQQVPVRQQYALGSAGGAGGVQEGARIVHAHRRRRRVPGPLPRGEEGIERRRP
ncbi:MAG: hypothetical protein QM809_06190 [Gordonia sp. (in: high G+C Gram-positive bacteria)]